MNSSLILAIPFLVVGALANPDVAAADQAFTQLRLIAPAAPGGGWDQTARAMQQVLQGEGLASVVPVENIAGAAGTIGLARFVNADAGHADVLLVTGLVMLGAIVTNSSPITLNAVTPVARLTGEYEVIVVPASSPFKTLRELLDAFAKDPGRVSWGGGSAGGTDQILVGMLAQQAGVSPSRANYIAFSGGGESLSAILGRQVTAGVNGLAELEAHITSGGLRALGITSRERLPDVAIPTLREQGIGIELANWRAVVAPPGLGADARHRLVVTIEKMVRSERWRNVLRRMGWADLFLAGTDFDLFLAREEARVSAIVRGLRGQSSAPASADTKAAIFPVLIGAGLASVACALIVQRRKDAARARAAAVHAVRRATRTSTGTAGAEPARVSGPHRRRITLLAVGVALDILLLEPAGFIVASAALFWFTARAFGSQRPIRDAIVAIGLSAASFLVFARGLGLSLPAGPLARFW